MVDTIGDEALKNSLLEMKKGDHFEANIFELEKDKDEKYVRKYFLNMDEEEDREVQPMFQFEILKVERLVPADLDQEFFVKQFGEGKVTSEEEAREALREDIKKFYDQQAEQILFRDIQEKMLELNDIALPDDFLKRFLVSENEETTAEEVENDYENISKSFQWTILRNKLVEEFDVKVEAEDVRNELRGQVAQYMGGYAADEAFMNSMIERLMQDENQVNSAYENQLGSKLFLRLKNEFKQTPKSIGLEDFQETIKKLNAESQGNQA
jgi:trigger factor